MAKKFKKEKVCVDVVSFGEDTFEDDGNTVVSINYSLSTGLFPDKLCRQQLMSILLHRHSAITSKIVFLL